MSLRLVQQDNRKEIAALCKSVEAEVLAAARVLGIEGSERETARAAALSELEKYGWDDLTAPWPWACLDSRVACLIVIYELLDDSVSDELSTVQATVDEDLAVLRKRLPEALQLQFASKVRK